MDTVNLGIIGLGNWGNKLATSLQKIPEANLISCFARTEKRGGTSQINITVSLRRALISFLKIRI